ncbi:MAG: hypothetical protein RI948_1352 [Bacteroidota bacterium]|jgi:hypothetical protein
MSSNLGTECILSTKIIQIYLLQLHGILRTFVAQINHHENRFIPAP